MEGDHQSPTGFGGLACRAVLQLARKERWSFPSPSVASITRCCMPSACNCWIEQACLVSWYSAFLIAVEQQFSTSAMMEAWLALASFMQVACWASALLLSVAQWASASLMVQIQRGLASLMALVVSNSIWQRTISKSRLASCGEHWRRI